MDKEEFLKIKEKLAEKIKNENVEPKYPYELFGVECGKGWKHLYQPITDFIMEYNKEHEDNPIIIHQIKEKFGGLRYYVSNYIDGLAEMIDKAEDESYNTCEICGKHIDEPIIEHHWIYPQCKECFEALRKK